MENNSISAPQVIVGAEYRHTEGIKYRVDSVLLNATGYESGAELRQFVLYTQLVAGHYPVGTQWVREESDFLEHFERI
ncbi:hypothetical protein IPJ72_02420 [Candidatus Peregrinibacteria bacterium]|nr:MAG: hypothetical protein IPJ72_02420 [Candidatus Peregrinibacteria bacterium]